MKNVGRPPREEGKRWALVEIKDDEPRPPGLVVKEIGSGVFKPNGGRWRCFREVEA